MKIYHIYNNISGKYVGGYPADTEDAAANAMVREAGYADFAEFCDTLGVSVDDAKIDLLHIFL
jgi:hypothetical protein